MPFQTSTECLFVQDVMTHCSQPRMLYVLCSRGSPGTGPMMLPQTRHYDEGSVLHLKTASCTLCTHILLRHRQFTAAPCYGSGKRNRRIGRCTQYASRHLRQVSSKSLELCVDIFLCRTKHSHRPPPPPLPPATRG